MKKLCVCLVACALLGFTSNAFAQMKMAAGIKGGLAMATETGKDFNDMITLMNVDKAFRVGMDIGGMFKMNFSDMFGLVLEINYANKGVKIQPKTDASNNYSVIKFDYLDIPVLANFTFMQGPVAPYINVGPLLSFNLSAKSGGKSGGVTVPDQKLDSVSGMDFGVAAGAGVGIAAGPGKILVEYRFSAGFITTDGSSGTKQSAYNMVPVTILVGYLFGF